MASDVQSITMPDHELKKDAAGKQFVAYNVQGASLSPLCSPRVGRCLTDPARSDHPDPHMDCPAAVQRLLLAAR